MAIESRAVATPTVAPAAVRPRKTANRPRTPLRSFSTLARSIPSNSRAPGPRSSGFSSSSLRRLSTRVNTCAASAGVAWSILIMSRPPLPASPRRRGRLAQGPGAQSRLVGGRQGCPAVHHPVIPARHLVRVDFLPDLRQHPGLPCGVVLTPVREIHRFPRFADVARHQPGDRRDMAVQGPDRLVRMAIVAGAAQDRPDRLGRRQVGPDRWIGPLNRHELDEGGGDSDRDDRSLESGLHRLTAAVDGPIGRPLRALPSPPPGSARVADLRTGSALVARRPLRPALRRRPVLDRALSRARLPMAAAGMRLFDAVSRLARTTLSRACAAANM